jgi:hypothetical protein
MPWTTTAETPLVSFMEKFSELCRVTMTLQMQRQTNRTLQQIRAKLYSAGAPRVRTSEVDKDIQR